jgi:DNA-binding LacI/PurR family transcriptional regulator
MATIDDVVKAAGVSRSTVFRFLNGGNVRPQARETIQLAMKQLDYYYNPRHSREDIRLIVSLKDNYEGMTEYADMVSGIMSRAESLGLNVKLRSGYGPAIAASGAPIKNRQGVIIIGKENREEEEEAAILRNLGIPYIFVNRVFTDLSTSFVSINLRLAAQEAVEYLIDLGYTSVGTWGRPATYRIDAEKMAGFRDAFKHRGLPVPPYHYTFEDNGDLVDVVRRLFRSGTFPRAWFGMSDNNLMLMAPVIREFKLRVPEDIALVGMDDIEPSRFFSPPITSVHIPFKEAGSRAVDALLGMLEDPLQLSARIILRHELIIRESCGGLAWRKS